jgi:hypothetical protein
VTLRARWVTLTFSRGAHQAAAALEPPAEVGGLPRVGSSLSVRGLFNSASMDRLPTMDDICGQFATDAPPAQLREEAGADVPPKMPPSASVARELWNISACLV